jgi:hypothetical protein
MDNEDRTSQAVELQLGAFECDWFEVGIRDSETGRMLMREWSSEDVEKSISWLKHMNGLGNDIYIRPQGSQGIVLVDDLKADELARMKRDGYEPAILTETSPKNYQAWVRVSKEPISQAEATQAAKHLAREYGGDPNSADWRHFGRLAGFTNRKPEHRANGKQPFVLLRESSGRTASRGEELLGKIRAEATEQERAKRVMEIERHRATNPSEMSGQARKGTYRADPAAEYRRLAQPILKKQSNPDWSKVDWMVAKELARRGWTKEGIGRAIREASPHLAERKAGHVEDYISRTVGKAMQEHDRFRDMGYEIGR